MAIWNNIVKRVLGSTIEQTLDETIRKKQGEQIEKAIFAQQMPLGAGMSTSGNDTGKLFSRGLNYETLRNFSLYYPVLRACINYRKRQITQLDWAITPREVIVDKKKKEKYKKDAKDVSQIFKNITGDKTVSFRTFLNKILEDLLVLDAMAVYKRRNRRGGIYGFMPVDASTINIALYEDGTLPQPPDYAYIQKINGQEVAQLTVDDLIYRMMNPRTNSPYGLSPVETLIIIITTALKLSSYNLAYLTEGNVPEGFVELPKDIASDADQLTQWQNAWDAMFSGDPGYQRKIKFLPEGMKWNPIRKAGDMEFERFEKWLLLNTCSILEVAPQAIGFQFERGKGATEAEWEIGKERGLYPTANILKEIFDEIIQNDLGMDHLEFAWMNINPTNAQEEAKVFETLVRSGAVSVDEWRIAEGYDPIGLGNYIMTPLGPFLVEEMVNRPKGGNPNQPYAPALPNNQMPAKPQTSPQTMNEPPKPNDNVAPQSKPTDDDTSKITKKMVEETVDEFKKWKKVALNDFKQGKSIRDFQSDIIDSRTQKIIKDALKSVKTRDEINEVFDMFIEQENKVILSLLELYDDINEVIRTTKT